MVGTIQLTPALAMNCWQCCRLASGSSFAARAVRCCSLTKKRLLPPLPRLDPFNRDGALFMDAHAGLPRLPAVNRVSVKDGSSSSAKLVAVFYLVAGAFRGHRAAGRDVQGMLLATVASNCSPLMRCSRGG